MSKIYNNINESDFIFKYGKLTFYFSSEFYLNKFIKEHQEFIKNEEMKMKIKFRCLFYGDEMILLLLYKKIEKRGFKVLYEDKEILENYYCSVDINKLSLK